MDSNARIEEHRERAQALFEAGDYPRARVEITNVLRLDRSNASDLLLAGKIQKAQGNYRRAYSLFQSGYDLDPTHVGTLVQLAQIYVLTQEAGKALAMLDTVLATEQDHADAHALRATALLQLDDDVEGKNALRRSLELEPGNAIALPVSVGLTLSEQGAAAAIAQLGSALEQAPSRGDLLILLARIQADSGDLTAAAQTMKTLVALDPENTTLRSDAARLLRLSGDPAAGEATLREPLEAEQPTIAGRLALVQYLASDGRRQAALDTVNGFLSADETQHDLRVVRADLMAGIGLEDMARSEYHNMLETPPSLGIFTAAGVGLARLELQRGDRQAALGALNRVLAEHSTSVEALILRARMAVEDGDAEAAIQDLRAALSADRANPALRFDLARLYIATGEWSLAEAQLRLTIEEAPAFTRAHLALARLQMERGDLATARTGIDAVLAAQPEHTDALALAFDIESRGRNWRAAAALARRVEQAHPDRSLGYYLSGLAALAGEDNAAAEAALKKALSIDPQSIEPLTALVRLLSDSGRASEAARRVDETVSQFPDHAGALNLRGQLSLASGDYEAAAQQFSHAARWDPQLVDAYRGLAASRLRQDDEDGAAKALRSGIDVVPTDQAELLSVDLTLLRLRQERATDAVAEAERYLRENPGSSLTINNLAMMLITHEPYTNSVERARIMVDELQHTSNPQYLDTYAAVLARNGEQSDALAAIGLFENRFGSNGLVTYRRGLILEQLGQPENARVAFAEAISLSPEAAFVVSARRRLNANSAH
ncbi:MAG: tetratricopeptide repeat protein [Pseudomonadota bacterium]